MAQPLLLHMPANIYWRCCPIWSIWTVCRDSHTWSNRTVERIVQQPPPRATQWRAPKDTSQVSAPRTSHSALAVSLPRPHSVSRSSFDSSPPRSRPVISMAMARPQTEDQLAAKDSTDGKSVSQSDCCFGMLCCCCCCCCAVIFSLAAYQCRCRPLRCPDWQSVHCTRLHLQTHMPIVNTDAHVYQPSRVCFYACMCMCVCVWTMIIIIDSKWILKLYPQCWVPISYHQDHIESTMLIHKLRINKLDIT